MAPKKPTPKGVPSNVIQFRGDLSRVMALKAAATRMGITPAEAGKQALQLWLDKNLVPVKPIHPEAQSTKT